MSNITRILGAIEAGEPDAAEALFRLVYDELRRFAAAKMAREAPGQTLQPTALVHEAWLRLGGDGQPSLWLQTLASAWFFWSVGGFLP